ncbi:hypothetical protein ABW19_dt0200186 [Dactylella cylindrospora]|nr:hypothetical protein ABW19_dt0200186 [Dactylella cylindrospora]
MCSRATEKRIVSQAEAFGYFKNITDECAMGTGAHYSNQLTATELPVGGSIGAKPLSRQKRQPGNACHDIMGHIPYTSHPLEYRCHGARPTNPDGSCPVSWADTTEELDCAIYCEIKRTFYWDAPVDWEPERDPICDTDSITLQQARTQTTGVTYGPVVTIGDPWGVFSIQLGNSYYKEVGNTLGVEAGSQSLPDGAGFRCDFSRLTTTQNACTYWEYTDLEGRPLGINTVEYVWDGQNTKGGAVGQLAPNEYQTPEYLSVGKGKPPVVVNP